MATALQRAIQQGLKAFRQSALGIQTLCSYESAAQVAYNATTGTVSKATALLDEVPVILAKYEQSEIDGEAVRPEDQKALVAVVDLAVTPAVGDTLTLSDGGRWSVVRRQRDPASAVWVMQVRRP